MAQTKIRPDLYISADVETDGSIPGLYSLLSFGLSAIGRYDGEHFERWDPREHTFYREMSPITEQFQAQALKINGLDREHLRREGCDPVAAMREAAEWITTISSGCRPVLVAYPVAFDWAFLYWYFERFAPDGSPFGHSSCLDIRTQYHAIAGTVFDLSSKTAMPQFLQPRSPHTHNALDDAVEQGELFANLLEWSFRMREAHVPREDSSMPSWLTSHELPIA